MQPIAFGRTVRSVLVFLSAMVLTGCLLSPGKFTSELDIRKDRTFTYRYTGEIHILPLSKVGQTNSFEPQPCYDEDGFEERDCTSEELAEQRTAAAAKQKQEAESAKAFLGGIDISDPKAAEELAERLRRQAGWRKVQYMGEGLFNVDFMLTGRLDHDFVFPTIERFPMANAFVQLAIRSDGTVRMDAPGFGPGAGGNPIAGMMQAAASSSDGGKQDPDAPEIDGTFVLRTDGAILANNTDEGPRADPSGQTLQWKVNARTPAPPTALIRLNP